MKFKTFAVAVVLFSIAAANYADEISIRQTSCRLYDSRHIGGFNSGSVLSTATIETQVSSLDTIAFSNGGVNYNSQGGEAGCRIPLLGTGGILSVLIWSPTGTGWGRLWPFNSTEPLSTVINSSGTVNENSGVHVPLGTDGKISYHASFTSHLIIELTGRIEPCVPETTFELAYSESQSSISVPETGDINLLKYYYPGAKIWLGGQASQPGLYSISGATVSNGRQRLFVSPTPEAATDTGLEVHLLSGSCSPRETPLLGNI